MHKQKQKQGTKHQSRDLGVGFPTPRQWRGAIAKKALFSWLRKSILANRPPAPESCSSVPQRAGKIAR